MIFSHDDVIRMLRELPRVDYYEESDCLDSSCCSYITSEPASDGEAVRWSSVEGLIKKLEALKRGD